MVPFHFILLTSAVHASSWFSSEPDYAKWSGTELRNWLERYNVKVPPSFDQSHLYDLVDANWRSLPSLLEAHVESSRQWSLDQYNQAQRTFQHIKDDSFDQWDESRLRAFLLEHGVVAPSGPREQLVLLAKNKYRAYTDAAAFYSSLASGSMTAASAHVTDAVSSIAKSVTSAAVQATDEVTRKFDDTKDYIYSTWDDTRLRGWLEDHGIVEAKSVHTRNELTRLASDYYRRTASAVWDSWSDPYIREWLISHNLLQHSDSLPRPSLLGEMKKYYYACTDKVWHTWSDSELKSWLVNHHLLKSNTQKNRDELIKMLEEYYPSALDVMWSAWTDTAIREWLSENGHLNDDVKNRKDLVDLINSKYPIASAEVHSYLVWPDARLRAYLRERGISEDVLPTGRPGLLQETRIRWVQASTGTETAFAKLKGIVSSSVGAVEEKVSRALEALSGRSRDAAHYAFGMADDSKYEETNAWGGPSVDEAVKHTHQHGDPSVEENVFGVGDEL